MSIISFKKESLIFIKYQLLILASIILNIYMFVNSFFEKNLNIFKNNSILMNINKTNIYNII
jgi:hypothetical protein